MAFKRDWSKFCSEDEVSGNAGNFDLLTFLWEMNLIHVLEDIVSRIDSFSLASCLRVSRGWNEILGLILAQEEAMKKRRKTAVVLETEAVVVTSLEVDNGLVAVGTQDGMVRNNAISTICIAR